MFGKAKMIGNACGCFEFASVPLAVVEGQADDAVALFQGQGRGCGGIQSTGEQRNGSALAHLRVVSS